MNKLELYFFYISMADLLPFEAKELPSPYGLHNTGCICYFNSFLQAFASCTQIKKMLKPETDLTKVIIDYLNSPNPSSSRIILSVFASKLKGKVRFGVGQESASEAFVLLLEQLPIETLFLNRSRCVVMCSGCKKVFSDATDLSTLITLFHLDSLPVYPSTSEDFARAIISQKSEIDMKCCAKVFRTYTMQMLPEILFCTFNLYGYAGGQHKRRYFPEEMLFPSIDGKKMRYILVSQIEHSGTLHGGHYWARCLRRDGKVYTLNDSGVSPSKFEPSPGTYIIVYCFTGLI